MCCKLCTLLCSKSFIAALKSHRSAVFYADTGQADILVSSRQQGTHSGKDVSVTGQALGSPAVAGRAGTNAAAMGASGSQPSANGLSMQNGAGPDSLETAALEPATQKALLPALLVMFEQHSVVNLADIRYDGNDGQAILCVLAHERYKPCAVL